LIYNNKSLLRYRYLLYNIFIMKKIFWLVSLLWVLILSWCWSSTNVIEYNDSFVALVKECTDANQALYQNFNAEWSTIDSITQALQNNISICQDTQAKASQMWDYEKDSSLKDAVVNLLTMEVEYLQKFSETSRYRNMDNLTNEDKELYNWIVSDLNQAQNLLNQQFTNLQDVQEAFAAKHGLKLE
jgi:hypothetical protein